MTIFSTNKMIACLFFILLIPFIVVCTYTWFYIEFSSKHEFQTTISRFTANASKANIETPVNKIKQIFRSLSSNLDEADIEKYLAGQPTDLDTVIPAITDSTVFFSHIIISNPADKYKIYPNVALTSFSPRSRPWYPMTATKDFISYSDPYTSMLSDISGTSKSKKKSITASMNLFNKHSDFIGNIAFDLDLKSISSTINNKTSPYNGKFLIVATSGEVVLSENKIEILRKKVPQSWIEQASNVEGNFHDSQEKVFVFYKTYMNPDWIAFTVVNESDYKNISSSAMQTFWIVTLCCLVFYMVMVVLAKLYMEQIISRLYMSINGIDPKKEKITISAIYENIRESKKNLEKAVHDSTTDGLTQIFNRRKFDIDTHSLASSKHTFFLAMIDIDNFKKINDTYGHDTGDIVLKTVSKMGRQVIDSEHNIYRFGGEELCVIYVGEDYDYFYQLIATWLKMVSIREWREPDLQVTFSAGIAKFTARDTVEQILKHADEKLYQAKSTGKNRIIGL
ncbi:sensor domain-containing diguanylate cyclase [Leclercia sp.]|uniref:sensor domain-containing diguanylate cyclase n=1 Tax=Leclercia sp. TaxID=1898428 RepID=UPI002FDDC1E0